MMVLPFEKTLETLHHLSISQFERKPFTEITDLPEMKKFMANEN